MLIKSRELNQFLSETIATKGIVVSLAWDKKGEFSLKNINPLVSHELTSEIVLSCETGCEKEMCIWLYVHTGQNLNSYAIYKSDGKSTFLGKCFW